MAFVGEANPSKPSPLRPDVMGAVESLTKEMFPGVIVVPVMSTGATDGLYLRNGEIPTYGVDGTFGDMDDVRAHGRDERVGVKQFFEGLEFQYRLIKALAQYAMTRVMADREGSMAMVHGRRPSAMRDMPCAACHLPVTTGPLSFTHVFQPPTSARTLFTPRSLSMSAARALVNSSCQAQ